jgi:uncharacterized repeat protein (TIGR02543 family)
MSLFKCKMCGGELNVHEGETVVTCEFCGTKQTVPNNDSEKKTNLFNRANSLRQKNEFDKALLTYQSIVAEFPNEAEAYWGIVLCRFGIEYIDDPQTHRKKPTIHRASFETIAKDPDFLLALSKSDVVARKEYQSEAEEISIIQKNILSISQKEDSFDVFICYKETDDSGKRTKDSVVAEQIYEALTEKGYKVFFSRITLEKKIGLMYEPYIFAALNSSKIMLAIGTKSEYFNSVWVKNEWARYLSLMQTGEKRYLIPCYLDMDAYELPEEMMGFQAQDLSKLGFMQDLLRGIDKLMGRDAPKVFSQEKTTIIQSDINIPSLLKRSEILIGDGNFEKADGLLEKVLNNDPTNSSAYLFKLLEDLHVKHIDDLINQPQELDNQYNFKKAYEFGDDQQKKTLDSINQTIKDRIEYQRLSAIYENATRLKEEKQWADAEKVFSGIAGFKDSQKQAEECISLGKEDIYRHAILLKEKRSFDEAIDLFTKVLTYKDSEDQIEGCENEKELARKESIYQKALSLEEADGCFDEEKATESINLLKQVAGYKDSDELLLKRQKELDDYEKMIQEKIEAAEKAQKIKRDKQRLFLKIAIPSFLCIVIIFLCTFFLIVPAIEISTAANDINGGNYSEALVMLEKSGDFGDSSNLKHMVYAGQAFESLDYEKGIDEIYNIGGQVSVDYDGNGGETDQNSQTIKKKYITTKKWLHFFWVGLEQLQIDARKYITTGSVKNGYTFFGWVLSSYKLDARNHSASIVLKASYNPIIYSISYAMNGIQRPDSFPTTYTTESTISIPNPERTGYTFIGWTGTDLSESTTDYVISAGTIGNKVLVANWKANVYTVTLDVQGGSIDKKTIEVTFDSNFVIPTPTRVGYNFSGWSLNGKIISASGTWSTASDSTLLANWTARNDIKYTINYYGQNISDDNYSLMDSTIKTGTADSLIAVSPQNLTGFTANSGSKAQIISPNGSTVFSFYYKRNSYYLSFISNGGNSIEMISLRYQQTIPSNIDVTRDGYTFGGWFSDYSQNTLFSKMPAENSSVYAWWKEETKACFFQVTFSNNKASISYSSNLSGEIVVPTFINNCKVTEVGENTFANNHFISKVTIPEFVTSIGQNAFLNCTALTSLVGGSNVNEIGDYAFSGCTSFQNIPSFLSLETIGTSSFQNCSKIVLINPGTSLTTIGNYAFSGCTSLKSMPNSAYLTKIGDYAFENCTSMANIPTADSLLYIGQFAFYGCKSFTQIVVGNSVSFIGQSAFGNCTKVSEASFPVLDGKSFYYFFGSIEDQTTTAATGHDGITYYISPLLKKVNIIGATENSIADYAFYDANFLTEINISESITRIGDYCFASCTEISQFKFPESLSYLGNFSLSGCSSLQNLDVPFSGITSTKTSYLGLIFGNVNYSGSYLDSTSSFYFPSTLKKLEIRTGNLVENACAGIKTISNLIIDSQVSSIGEGAFKGCSALEGVTLPFCGCSASDASAGGSYSSVFEKPFGGEISSIRSAEITSQAALPANAFSKCSSLSSVTVPEGTTSIGPSAFEGCSSLARLNSSADGVFSIPSGVTAIPNSAFSGCVKASTVSLPSTVESIGSYAFDGCSGVRKMGTDSDLTINSPESCKTIGSYAFQGLSLAKTLCVGPACESIGEGAFKGCSALEGVTLPFCGCSASDASAGGSYSSVFEKPFGGEISSIRSAEITSQAALPANAFSKCSSLSSVTVPEGTTSIGPSAFEGCSSLARLNSSADGVFSIPSGVTAIPNSAFSGCVKASTVSLPSTVESIGSYAFDGCSGVRKIGTDSDLTINSPESCRTIGSYAFQGLSLAKTLCVGPACESIGEGAFKGCSALEGVTLPFCGCSASDASAGGSYSSVFEKPFGGEISSIRSAEITSQAALPANAFSKCSSLSSVTVPEGTTSIGPSAFEGCSSLARLNSSADGVFSIPSGVAAIPDSAFSGCVKASTVSLPSTVESIGSYAFNSLSLLKKITVSSTCTSIGISAFKGCSSIEEVSLPFCGLNDSYSAHDSGYSVLKNLFGDSASFIKHLEITTQTVIPAYAFYSLSNLISVSLLSTTSSIGEYAFYGCSSLLMLNSETEGEFNIPSGLTSIANYTFSGCSRATMVWTTISNKLNVPASISSIGKYAFQGLSLIKAISVSSSCQTIGVGAFNGCYSLEEISVPFCGESANSSAYNAVFGFIFGFVEKDTSNLPTTVKSAQFQNVNYSTDSNSIWQYTCCTYSPYNNGYYYASSFSYYIPTTIKKVTILKGMAIPEAAFNGCTFITEIHLTASPKPTYGTYSFQNCTATIFNDV